MSRLRLLFLGVAAGITILLVSGAGIVGAAGQGFFALNYQAGWWAPLCAISSMLMASVGMRAHWTRTGEVGK
jgi:hypothetical protein